MKKILYILVFLTSCATSCQKEEFDYALYEPTADDIDRIYLSTGGPTLIADGKATTQLVLETYRTLQIKDHQGNNKDTSVFVDYKLLPEADVQVFANGQAISGLEFKTTQTNLTEVEFYAQVGATRSDTKTVTIRQPQAIPVKRTVQVVFHVFELSTTDAAYDPLVYQDITPKQLEEAIDYANQAFGNVYGKDPNGADAGIVFKLAERNAAGVALSTPGYNKITYDTSWKTSVTAVNFALANFTSRINATATASTYQWNKDAFLNIYILPFPANTSIGDNRARYQIVPTGETAIAGITTTVNSIADVPTTDFYTTYGLGLHRTVFFPGLNRRIEIASYLGIYYGLYRPGLTAATGTDHVNDTRKYLLTGSNESRNLLKVALDGEKFLANNAMDDIRYASLRNSFTLDQVTRMRLVMDRSPVRKSWVQE